MRMVKLNTPLLALALSVLAEALLVICFVAFGRYSAFGPANVGTALIVYFHGLADAVATHLVPHDTGIASKILSFAIIVVIGLLQWFTVFFLSISVYQRFCRRAV